MSEKKSRPFELVDGGPFEEPIECLLPHREPFLFVDKLSYVDKLRIEGEATYEPEMWFFKGHFPKYPVVPGVILIETMAQCGGAGMIAAGLVPAGRIFFLVAVDNVKFRRQVRPGETVRMEIENVKISSRIAKQHGKAFVGDELAAEGDFKCVLGPEDENG